MPGTSADGGEAGRWGVALPVVVVAFGDSPALDRAVGAQAASVPKSCANGGEDVCWVLVLLRWGVALPVVVVSPALDPSVLVDRAPVKVASANGDKAGDVFGRTDRDLGAP